MISLLIHFLFNLFPVRRSRRQQIIPTPSAYSTLQPDHVNSDTLSSIVHIAMINSHDILCDGALFTISQSLFNTMCIYENVEVNSDGLCPNYLLVVRTHIFNSPNERMTINRVQHKVGPTIQHAYFTMIHVSGLMQKSILLTLSYPDRIVLLSKSKLMRSRSLIFFSEKSY